VIASVCLLPFLLLAPPAAQGELRIEVRSTEDGTVVDASASDVDPRALLRELALKWGRSLRGDELLAGADPLDLQLAARDVDELLRALSFATGTRIAADRDAISIAPDHDRAPVSDLDVEAEGAWLEFARAFPRHEGARLARVELGLAQERRGQDDAALAHYDVASRTDEGSPAALLALESASKLLARRGQWDEALPRLSQLALRATTSEAQASARVTMARALAEQGRGVDALALLEAVDLSYPPADAREALDRRLVCARAHLACAHPLLALNELDARAAADPQLGAGGDDLELRARALEAIGSFGDASRAWLAFSSTASPSDRSRALVTAARLAAAGGDDLGVLFVERVARGSAREAEVARFAGSARARLGLVRTEEMSLASLEQRWSDRAHLGPVERAALAARLVVATDRGRGVDQAANVARAALAELDGADGMPIRAALATAYERHGRWLDAARTWGGMAP